MTSPARAVLAATVLALVGTASGALPAQAAQPARPAQSAPAPVRTGTLTCTDGEVMSVSGQLYGTAWDVVGTTSTFVVTYLEVQGTGQVLVPHSPGKDRLATHRCAYTVSDREQSALVEGYLTPAT